MRLEIEIYSILKLLLDSKMKNLKILIHKIIFLFTLAIIGLQPGMAQETQLTIIGNTQSVPGELNMNQLRSVLRGEKLRWDDGSSIKIALMKTNTAVGTDTCKKIYNMTGNELNKYFLALVFQGKVKAPTFFNTVSELESYVAQTPGAIGVSQNSSNSEIKIVLVDGKNQF